MSLVIAATDADAIMAKNGYVRQPDGSFSRPDSHARAAFSPKTAAIVLSDAAYRKAKTVPAKKSPLAVKFEAMWHELGGQHLVPEHRICKDRKWRADYAHAPSQILIELEGGIHSGGRHTRAAGFKGDCEKYNRCAADGWIVFRLCTGMITAENITPIIATIRRKLAE